MIFKKRRKISSSSPRMDLDFSGSRRESSEAGPGGRLGQLLPPVLTTLYSAALSALILPLVKLPLSLSLLYFPSLLALLLTLLYDLFPKPVLALLSGLTFLFLLAFLVPKAPLIKAYSPLLWELLEEGKAWWYGLIGALPESGPGPAALSSLLVFLLALFFFLATRIKAAPALMLGLASTAYGLLESFRSQDLGSRAKYAFLLAVLVCLYWLALGKKEKGAFRAGGIHAGRQSWALLMAFLLVLATLFLDLALPDQIFRSRSLEKTITDLVEDGRGKGRRMKTYLDFSLAGLGYQPLESRLGGRAVPDPEPFLTIETDGYPVWLKGSARLTYTGQGWLKEGMNPRWLFNDDKAVDSQRIYVGVRHSSEDPLILRTVRPIRLNIFPRRPQQALFHGGRPAFYRPISGKMDFQAYFNRVGSIYLDREVPDQGYTLLGQSILPIYLTSEEGIETLIMGYESPVKDRLQLPDEERRANLALPELKGLEDKVRAFDPDLHTLLYRRNNAITDSIVIEGIVRSLSSRLTYSMDAGIPDEDVEFVGWFLEEGKGYCTFFATAVTVMARQAGIPARYVEGFLVPATEGGKHTRQTLTGERGHAWAEVWFDGLGWIPVDATPPDRLKEMAKTAYMTGFAPEIEEPEPTQAPTIPESTLEEIPEATLPPPVTEEEGGDKAWSRIPFPLKFLLALAPLWILLLWRYLAFYRRHDERSQIRRLEKMGEAAFLGDLTGDLFRLWALDGRGRRPQETLRNYIRRVEMERYEAFPAQLAGWLEDMTYGPPQQGLQLDRQDLRKLLDFYREEEHYLRGELGFGPWFLKRWLTSFRPKGL